MAAKMAAIAVLSLAAALLTVQAEQPEPVAAAAPPAGDAALAPAALEADDQCGPDDDGSCSLSLRQLRGEAETAGQEVAAEGGAADNEAAALVEEEGAVKDGQLPSWWYRYYHPPSYVPNYKPHSYHHPSSSYHPAGPAKEMQIYLYRAKGAKDYEDTSVNMASLAGVMWYLHNEVVRSCPRKFGITRVIRYKVTMKAPDQLHSAMHSGNFAHLCHFDSGKCTGPGNSIKDYDRYGYAVGCDKPSTHVAAYKDATWFSMPGKCPRSTFAAKSRYPMCKYQDPGGECAHGQAWSKTCTWRKEYAGEVSLAELTGVTADHTWCRQGNYEWKDHCDCGHGTSFWNGKKNSAACTSRMEKLRSLFQRKYPNMPADLGDAHCPFGDRNR